MANGTTPPPQEDVLSQLVLDPEVTNVFVTLSVLVDVASLQDEADLVYVITALPTPTALATPLDASIVTADVLSEVKVPLLSPLVVIVTVEPTFSDVFPLNVPAFGVAVLVNTTSSVASEHEPFDTVHVNVALLPAVTLVTPEL